MGVSFRDHLTRRVSDVRAQIGTKISPGSSNRLGLGNKDIAILKLIQVCVSELYSFIQDIRTLALVFGFTPIIVLVWTLPFVGIYFSHVDMPNILISDLLESNKTIYKSLFTFGMCSAGATSLFIFSEYSKHLNVKFERHLRHINSKLHEIIQDTRANSKARDDLTNSAKRMKLITNDTMRLKK